MRSTFTLLAAVLALTATVALANDDDKEELGGHKEFNGYSLIAPADYPPQPYADDPGMMQTFEIIRPDARAITLSRLLTTCQCVQLEAGQASFQDGERAFLRLRNVKPTERKLYPFYVQIASPESVLLTQETYVESYFPPDPDDEDYDDDGEFEEDEE